MDERPRRLSNLLALLWLPLALAILAPVLVVLALSFYLRAAASGLASLARYLSGRPAPPMPATQRPHFIDVLSSRPQRSDIV